MADYRFSVMNSAEQWGSLETYRDLWGSVGICGDLWGSVGICGDLWGSVGIYGGLRGTVGDCGGLRGTAGDSSGLRGSAGDCRDLQGSIWPHTPRHSETFLVGPARFPVLQPLAPGKILSRTGRTTNRSPSSSYPQDGRTAPLRTLSATNPDFTDSF